jgi:hypothetical protein
VRDVFKATSADRGPTGPPKPNPAVERAVEVPRERRRRRAEASAEPFQELLPPAVTTPGRHLSVAETLEARRLGRERAAAVGPK